MQKSNIKKNHWSAVQISGFFFGLQKKYTQLFSLISHLPDSCERHPVRQEMASTSIPLVNCGCHVLLQVLGEDRKIQPKQTNENNKGEKKREYIIVTIQAGLYGSA